MTYKLNPSISKILSPVILEINNQCLEYENGTVAAEAVFNKRYLIKTVKAVENKIFLTLEELKAPSLNWNGEEAVSYF